MAEAETLEASRQLWCERMDDAAELLRARRLVASVYLDEGYVEATDLAEDGVLVDAVDSYHPHSDYFAVGQGHRSDPLLAVSRLIRFKSSAGERSFPMLTDVLLDDEFAKMAFSADLTSWVEVGSLAKLSHASAQAPNLLYRKMWQQAVREGHALWLFVADRRVSRTLKNLFGEEVKSVGPRQHFMGSPTDPLTMHPPTSADWLAEQAADAHEDDSMEGQLVRLALAFFLDGLEAVHFTEEQLDRFARGGVELRESSVIDLTEAPRADISR